MVTCIFPTELLDSLYPVWSRNSHHKSFHLFAGSFTLLRSFLSVNDGKNRFRQINFLLNKYQHANYFCKFCTKSKTMTLTSRHKSHLGSFKTLLVLVKEFYGEADNLFVCNYSLVLISHLPSVLIWSICSWNRRRVKNNQSNKENINHSLKETT